MDKTDIASLLMFVSIFAFIAFLGNRHTVKNTKTYLVELTFCDERPPEKIRVYKLRKPSNNDIKGIDDGGLFGGGGHRPDKTFYDGFGNAYINVCNIKVIKEIKPIK